MDVVPEMLNVGGDLPFLFSFGEMRIVFLGIENILVHHLKLCELLYLRQTSIIRESIKLYLKLLFLPS